MTTTRLVLLGASNPETARVLKAARRADPGLEVAGFLDNDPARQGKDFLGFQVLGGSARAAALAADPLVRFVNLITRDCVTRWRTSRELAALGARFGNLIHPDVDLELVELGAGNYVQDRVVLQAGVTLGDNSSVHVGTLVGHETRIGNSVFIAHGCNLSGCVTVEDGVCMGTGVSVVPRVRIGRWSVIGAGAVIIGDVPPHSLVVGNPGRVVRAVNEGLASGGIFP